MATLLEGKVSAFEGGDYELTNLRAAEYYIVYVSASYWPPCIAGAPQLVRDYNEKIKDNPEVEFILFSVDQSQDRATAWAKKENFPWPTITPETLKKEGQALRPLIQHFGRRIPEYLLFDKEGKFVEKGSKSSLFAKVGL